MTKQAQIKIAETIDALRVVFPQDLGRGIVPNFAHKQFEVDLSDFVGDGLRLDRDGRLNVDIEPVDLTEIENRLDDLEKAVNEINAKLSEILSITNNWDEEGARAIKA